MGKEKSFCGKRESVETSLFSHSRNQRDKRTFQGRRGKRGGAENGLRTFRRQCEKSCGAGIMTKEEAVDESWTAANQNHGVVEGHNGEPERRRHKVFINAGGR